MAKNKNSLEQIKPRIVDLMNQGHFSEALPLLKKTCKTNPGDSSLWLMQGVAQGAAGAYTNAEECLKRSIKISPRIPEAYYFLGKAQQPLGKIEIALDSYKCAIKLRPEYWEAHYAMARTLQQSGNPEKAINSYQKAIALNPSNYELHSHLAVAWKAVGKTLSALESFNESIRLHPGNPETWFNLGNLHHGHRELEEAISCYRKAVELKPTWVQAQLALSKMLLLQGNVDQAIDLCQSIRKAHPNNEEITAMEAVIFEQIGNFDDALTCLSPLIENSTNNVAALTTYAKIAPHFKNIEAVIELLESKLGNSSYDPNDFRKLHFALADLHDKIEDYDHAFEHYQKGNNLKPPRRDTQEWTKTIDLMIKFFNEDFFKTIGSATDHSKLPIFIVGMPRTGSTLLEQMLDRHSLMYGAGELPNMKNLAIKLSKTGSSGSTYPQCLASYSTANIDQVSSKYICRLAEFSDSAIRIIDKMPGNYLHLGLIQILFPGASVLHTQRDPVDTCLSSFMRDLTGSSASYTSDLSILGHYFKDYQRLMAHWSDVLSIPVHSVLYEEQVANTEKVMKDVIDYCGLAWESQCLDHSGNRRVVNTPSYGQVRSPIYSSSVKKWKHYEKHLGPLLKSLDL